LAKLLSGCAYAEAARFEGTVSGFNEDDALDLRDINFSAQVTVSYADTQVGSDGVLTVSDGANTTSIAFSEPHATADFHVHSDGWAGTLITVTLPDLA
jgi:hypothetical protein